VRILITGHMGFIGQWLWRELERTGHEAVGVDIRQAQNGVCDLRKPGVFTEQLGFHEADYVVHLAAQVGREFGEDDVEHTISSNVTMSALVGRACAERGVPLLYASSSEIYGDQGDDEVHESTKPRLPHNLYGLTKRQGEEVLALYGPPELAICRLSMPYGPGAPPGRGRRAMDNIIWQAQHGRPITIHRGAERSWCWVGDLVSAMRLIIEAGARGPFNVGRDDRPLSMEQLARWVCNLTDADESLIELVDPPPNQTVVKRLSTDKVRGMGWKPRIELGQGLPAMLRWIAHFDAKGKYKRLHGSGYDPYRRL
jgi:nucleoside-diphosphate-sugar epimerase